MSKISTFVFSALAAVAVTQTAQAQVKIGYTNIERMTVAQADEDSRGESTSRLKGSGEFNIGMPPTLVPEGETEDCSKEAARAGTCEPKPAKGNTTGDGSPDLITGPGTGSGPK